MEIQWESRTTKFGTVLIRAVSTESEIRGYFLTNSSK